MSRPRLDVHSRLVRRLRAQNKASDTQRAVDARVEAYVVLRAEADRRAVDALDALADTFRYVTDGRFATAIYRHEYAMSSFLCAFTSYEALCYFRERM